MTDVKVTCPACRGAKQVMKLGGMVGDCRLCDGVGKIKQSDLPAPKPKVDIVPVASVIADVANAIPHTKTEPVQQPQPIEDTIKVERRKAVYKHKRA